MKLVIQRVKMAKCHIEDQLHSEIGPGILLLTCFEKGDVSDTIDRAVNKIINLRIFEDDQGKMNKSILDVEGELLNVSQFTLCWPGEKGNRPSFEKSMNAREANLNFEIFSRKLSEHIKVKKGVFGADMQVELINDGPVTFHLSF